MAVLNLSVDFRSRYFAFRGRAGEPPRRFAPAGSHLPRTPAGVFVPSTPINRVPKSTLTVNTSIKKEPLNEFKGLNENLVVYAKSLIRRSKLRRI